MNNNQFKVANIPERIYRIKYECKWLKPRKISKIEYKYLWIKHRVRVFLFNAIIDLKRLGSR